MTLSWSKPRPVGLKVLYDDGWEEDWTLPLFSPPFSGFYRRKHFFLPQSQQRPQTKCGILEQSHVCVCGLCAFRGELPRVPCQRRKKKELAQNNTGILYEAIRPQVRGLLAGAVSSVWLLRATRTHIHITTQYNSTRCRGRVGQAYSSVSTQTEWTLVHANALTREESETFFPL